MAVITPTPIARAAATADPGPVVRDPGTHAVNIDRVPLDRMLFRFTDTGGGGDVSIAATEPGHQPLVFALGNGTSSWVGGLDSARFIQPDGTIQVTIQAAAAIDAFELPRA